jgi:4a-hydroxytetrahydrobiopterin dehydratase
VKNSTDLSLAEESCQPDSKKLSEVEIIHFLSTLTGWMIEEKKRITKVFSFRNFQEALHFANDVGVVAEAESHHPELKISWGRVDVVLSTHDVLGLSRNDFILAAKIDRLFPGGRTLDRSHP